MAISQYPAASWESDRQNRNCLPEIAPQGHFLALRAQGATSAVGLLAMTNLGASRRRIHAAIIASLQGAHYPQGARRIRKAAKPPTAAQ